MKLSEIINYIKPLEIINPTNSHITDIFDISYSSKTTKSNDIFVCLVGEKTDAHDFAPMAVQNGATAIVAQRNIEDINVPILIVEDTKLALAQISALLNDFPSKKLKLIGVTGTNGKTTVTHLVEKIFENQKISCGLIGTLGNRFTSTQNYASTNHTTPQSPELQKTLKEALDNNIKSVVMEVSSHALEQHRVAECYFDGAVLTNLTQDHLDYHITMDNYLEAKKKLFKSLDNNIKTDKYAVINKDDKYSEDFISAVPQGVKVLTYGLEKEADIMAKNIKYSAYGSEFECITPLGTKTVKLQIAGKFGVYNALAALGVGLGENIALDTCVSALEATKGVAGRFETVVKEPLIIVDYAHTPDGLENVLKAAKNILPANGKLICLFGCGGDRDATKRPQMGSIAEKYADKVLITSDNPRSEDPQQIITDILAGIKSLKSDKIMVEIDRRAAIEQAVKLAENNDILIVAGKGHEDYQILKDKTIHFDDREEVLKAFNKK